MWSVLHSTSWNDYAWMILRKLWAGGKIFLHVICPTKMYVNQLGYHIFSLPIPAYTCRISCPPCSFHNGINYLLQSLANKKKYIFKKRMKSTTIGTIWFEKWRMRLEISNFQRHYLVQTGHYSKTNG